MRTAAAVLAILFAMAAPAQCVGQIESRTVHARPTLVLHSLDNGAMACRDPETVSQWQRMSAEGDLTEMVQFIATMGGGNCVTFTTGQRVMIERAMHPPRPGDDLLCAQFPGFGCFWVPVGDLDPLTH